MLALEYLVVFGSVLGSSTYEWLLHHASSQLAGTYAFACPLVAVVLGWWLLGEQINGRTLLAAAAISALIMLHPEKPKARTKQAPGPLRQQVRSDLLMGRSRPGGALAVIWRGSR